MFYALAVVLLARASIALRRPKAAHTERSKYGKDTSFYYINCDSSPERRAHIERGLAGAGIRATRVSCSDAASRNETELARLVPCMDEYSHPKRLPKISLVLSNLLIFEEFLGTQSEWVGILEDDAEIPANLVEEIAWIRKRVPKAEVLWMDQKEGKCTDENITACIGPARIYTSFMMYSRGAVRMMLEELGPGAADNYIHEYHRLNDAKKHKAYCPWDYLINHLFAAKKTSCAIHGVVGQGAFGSSVSSKKGGGR
mmetsp:Transcript_114023/g.322808  ORF Transcript_114023/g.322808 Transcript_114023/m.322808 type:complete len:256 (-) Transcript_114023:122-889(-)